MLTNTAWKAAVASVFCTALGAGTALAQQVNLRLISGWNPNVAVVPLVESVFIKNVVETSKGEIKIQRSGPEVVPPFEQFQPLAAGVFDLLYTTGGYHQAQSGIANLMDAFKPDAEKRRETGLAEWADNYYRQRFGVRIIAMIPMPGNHFVLREPLTADNLKGRKIRSNPLYDGIVRALGGTPVNMAPADAFAAMQKGTIDGIAFPAYASTQFKLYEVAKFMTVPIFGSTNNSVMMNAKKFDSLSAAHQKLILDEGRRLEIVSMAAFRDLERQELEQMVKNGVKNVNFDAATGASLNRLYNEGIVTTTSKSTPAEVKTLFELAKSKNMINE